MDSKKAKSPIGWVYSLKVESRFYFVILLKLGHLDNDSQSQCRLCQEYSDTPTN